MMIRILALVGVYMCHSIDTINGPSYVFSSQGKYIRWDFLIFLYNVTIASYYVQNKMENFEERFKDSVT